VTAFILIPFVGLLFVKNPVNPPEAYAGMSVAVRRQDLPKASKGVGYADQGGFSEREVVI
jgi:hypothetical protein